MFIYCVKFSSNHDKTWCWLFFLKRDRLHASYYFLFQLYHIADDKMKYKPIFISLEKNWSKGLNPLKVLNP